jgi:hypothetical protein
MSTFINAEQLIRYETKYKKGTHKVQPHYPKTGTECSLHIIKTPKRKPIFRIVTILISILDKKYLNESGIFYNCKLNGPVLCQLIEV